MTKGILHIRESVFRGEGMEEYIKEVENFLNEARTRNYKGEIINSFDDCEGVVESYTFKAIDKILNHYKQLQAVQHDYMNFVGSLPENYIKKDKIREKIKEIQNYNNTLDNEMAICTNIIKMQVLNNILNENENIDNHIPRID